MLCVFSVSHALCHLWYSSYSTCSDRFEWKAERLIKGIQCIAVVCRYVGDKEMQNKIFVVAVSADTISRDYKVKWIRC